MFQKITNLKQKKKKAKSHRLRQQLTQNFVINIVIVPYERGEKPLKEDRLVTPRMKQTDQFYRVKNLQKSLSHSFLSVQQMIPIKYAGMEQQLSPEQRSYSSSSF